MEKRRVLLGRADLEGAEGTEGTLHLPLGSISQHPTGRAPKQTEATISRDQILS